MRRRTKWLIGIGLGAAVLVGGGTGVAVATGGADDQDVPVTGVELDRASAAALAHTGGGQVTGTEKGDEEGAYEIEVTLDDGTQVDVHLDEGFQVLGQVADADSGGDAD